MAQAQLHIRTGKQNGYSVTIHKENFVIGRSSQSDLALKDERVSRLHAVIRQQGDQFIIQDLESKSGTFVNDAPVENEPIFNNDVLRLGDTEISFIVLSSSPFKPTKPITSNEDVTLINTSRENIPTPRPIKLARDSSDYYVPRTSPIGMLNPPPYAPKETAYQISPLVIGLLTLLTLFIILMVVISNLS
jgi:pSer/pThr/pTyr-binding forkhead associated (FHA) protein